MIPALIIIAVVLALLFLFVIGIYNALIRLRNQVDNAWSQIDVQLKRRHDLIPNLVETAKGYMKHERGTFEAITNARSQAMGAKNRLRSRKGRRYSRRSAQQVHAGCGKLSRPKGQSELP